jgi:hypothetical protein
LNLRDLPWRGGGELRGVGHRQCRFEQCRQHAAILAGFPGFAGRCDTMHPRDVTWIRIRYWPRIIPPWYPAFLALSRSGLHH